MTNYWTGFLIATVIFVLWLIKYFYRQRNLPHGPMPLPFLGNILMLKRDTHLVLDHLATVYGPLFTIWFGRRPVVMVNDFYMAQEVFSRNGLKFSGRPDFVVNMLTKNKRRLPFMDYSPKFLCCQNICSKACSVDKLYLVECIETSLSDLISIFESEINKSGFDPADTFEQFVVNLMAKIVYGVTTAAEFSDFNLPGGKDLVTIANTTNFFPWMRLFALSSYFQFQEFITQRENILKGLFMASQKQTVSPSVTNVVTTALIEELCKEQLADAEILCSDLFIFGIEKLSVALKWLLLYFITWPEIQVKVKNELDNAYKENKDFLTMEESLNIPYLQAAIYETFRLSSFNPLSAIHQCNEPVTLKGYRLSKGTCVCVNLDAIHHSAKYWENAYEFNPTRFLESTPDGQKLCNIHSMKGFLAFGSGIRKCIGDELSMKLLTVTMANLLYKFHFEVPAQNMQPDLSGTSKLILVPRPYEVKITKG